MIQLSESLRIGFGIDGDSDAFVGDGWGNAEPASRWMLDTESRLSVPRPLGAEDLFLVLVLAPFVFGDKVTEQRLSLYINHVPQPGQSLRRPSVLIYKIDAALIAGSKTIDITFYHPDARQPSALQIWDDNRHLAFYVSEMLLLSQDRSQKADPFSQATRSPAVSKSASDTLTPAQLLLHFSSLGDNCELGLFQRRYGAEPIDIFRFSGISLPSVVLGLEERFEALCDPEQIFFEIVGPSAHREYILHHRRYGLQSHTSVIEGTLSLDRVIEREIRKLFFGRRLLMDDLASGQRIFVVKCNDNISLTEANRLSTLLRKLGPNTLLYVVPAAGAFEPGHVNDVGDGLLCGHMDCFLDYSRADEIASDCWMAICCNAYALWRSGSVPSMPDDRPLIDSARGSSVVGNIYEVVTDVIARELVLGTSAISPETELEDLPGWDSVTTAGVLLELENRFNVTFNRSELENVRTAADLVALIRA